MQTTDSRFSLEVLVNDRPLHEYAHRGETLVEGTRGSRFTLRVNNLTPGQVLALISIDGLSVMDGQEAHEGPNVSGYVLRSFQSMEIPGWRLSNNDVARFLFNELEQSYAAQMGTPRNIGVIGALFYQERRREPIRYRSATRGGGYDTLRGGLESLGPQTLGGDFGLERGMEQSKGIGTGFGERTEHRVHSVHFDAESTPSGRLVLRYDDEAGLLRRGIQLLRTSPNDRVMNADPFPANSGFSKPPRGWNG